MRTIRSLLAIIAILSFGSARAAEISGIPEIADGDAVVISGTKLRLLDMGAPELDQFCLDKNSEPWNCGIDARDALKKKAGGKNWACQTTRSDDHGRMLAACLIEKENITRWMVREGWAMLPTHRGYSHRYAHRSLYHCRGRWLMIVGSSPCRIWAAPLSCPVA
jgi:endonuclease YncB( thermonuclease family)